MSKIKDAIIRQDTDDLIFIGEIAEKFYKSQAGELLRIIVNGLQSEEILRYTHDPSVNSDLKMGRIEGVQKIIDAFEDMIARKTKLQDIIIEENKYGEGKRVNQDRPSANPNEL